MSAPYLGNSTLAKTVVAAFASISVAYGVFLHTSEIQLCQVKKKFEKAGYMTIYVSR